MQLQAGALTNYAECLWQEKAAEVIRKGLDGSSQLDAAHDIVVKTAETDATKRALPSQAVRKAPGCPILLRARLGIESTRDMDGLDALSNAAEHELQNLATLNAASGPATFSTFTDVSRPK
jgi:hypothetical protein